MKLDFSLHQTRSSRRSFALPEGIARKVELAARGVAEEEMPELTVFKLALITMSDGELLAMNRSALGHDWFTDIIT
ncbi:MAG: hypothetical protein ACHQNE_00905, partial [Candidatus Kapaibacterium sp.]